MHVTANYVYWLDHTVIYQAGLDGTGKKAVLEGVFVQFNANFEVDEANQTIYYMVPPQGNIVKETFYRYDMKKFYLFS